MPSRRLHHTWKQEYFLDTYLGRSKVFTYLNHESRVENGDSDSESSSDSKGESNDKEEDEWERVEVVMSSIMRAILGEVIVKQIVDLDEVEQVPLKVKKRQFQWGET